MDLKDDLQRRVPLRGVDGDDSFGHGFGARAGDHPAMPDSGFLTVRTRSSRAVADERLPNLMADVLALGVDSVLEADHDGPATAFTREDHDGVPPTPVAPRAPGVVQPWMTRPPILRWDEVEGKERAPTRALKDLAVVDVGGFHHQDVAIKGFDRFAIVVACVDVAEDSDSASQCFLRVRLIHAPRQRREWPGLRIVTASPDPR